MSITVKEKKHTVRNAILIIIAAAVIICAVGTGIVMSDVKGIKLGGNITIEVKEGEGSAAVARTLANDGIIKYPTRIWQAGSRF